MGGKGAYHLKSFSEFGFSCLAPHFSRFRVHAFALPSFPSPDVSVPAAKRVCGTHAHAHSLTHTFTHTCSCTQIVATTTGRVNIPYGDEESLKDALATKGPIAIALDASHPSLLFYSRCVFGMLATSASLSLSLSLSAAPARFISLLRRPKLILYPSRCTCLDVCVHGRAQRSPCQCAQVPSLHSLSRALSLLSSACLPSFLNRAFLAPPCTLSADP